MIGDFLNWTTFHRGSKYNLCYNTWIGGGSGIVFTKQCIITYLELIKNNNIDYCNHDLWLHKLFECSNKKSIKRIHCSGFHQYGAQQLLKHKNNNLLISIHLCRNMTLLNKFHHLQ